MIFPIAAEQHGTGDHPNTMRNMVANRMKVALRRKEEPAGLMLWPAWNPHAVGGQDNFDGPCTDIRRTHKHLVYVPVNLQFAARMLKEKIYDHTALIAKRGTFTVRSVADRLKYALHATEQPPEEPRAQHEDRPPSKRPRVEEAPQDGAAILEDMGDLADMVRQKAARENPEDVSLRVHVGNALYHKVYKHRGFTFKEVCLAMKALAGQGLVVHVEGTGGMHIKYAVLQTTTAQRPSEPQDELASCSTEQTLDEPGMAGQQQLQKRPLQEEAVTPPREDGEGAAKRRKVETESLMEQALASQDGLDKDRLIREALELMKTGRS